MADYTVLRQSKVRTFGGTHGIIVSYLILLVGIALMVVGNKNISFLPTQYVNSDKSITLTINRNGYYIGDEKLTQINGSIRETISNKINTNGLGEGLLIFGAFLIVFVVTNSNFNNALVLLARRLTSKKELPVLNIANAPSGIIAVRLFGVNNQGWLKSTARGVVWQSEHVQSDKVPKRDNLSGIYAYKLGARYNLDIFGVSTFGIVSLSGKCIGNRDHLVRAEYCSIVALVTKKERNAERLREHYSCPIIVSPSPRLSIETWAMSYQGTFWQRHNEQLIRELVKEGFERSITELPEYQTF